ncbi:GAF domain-containing protein, partial [Xanthomonadaceae bacterium JHOS43]|nr:GAF domain-containing protein [Xanthomonadaceae bacterium JHOS43]
AFEGHIACDAASRSELVIPVYAGDRLVGVFDLDSPEPARFDADDEAGMAAIAALFLESIE